MPGSGCRKEAQRFCFGHAFNLFEKFGFCDLSRPLQINFHAELMFRQFIISNRLQTNQLIQITNQRNIRILDLVDVMSALC